MSGSNRGQLSRGKGAVDVVLGAGCWTGRSMSYKNGPGVPGKKVKRKAWWEGAPTRAGHDGKPVSTRYSVRVKG